MKQLAVSHAYSADGGLVGIRKNLGLVIDALVHGEDPKKIVIEKTSSGGYMITVDKKRYWATWIDR